MLTLIRVRGLQLVWTVHNLHPHKPSTIRAFDRIARWLVTRVATKFFIHGAEAEAEAVRAYPIMAGRTVCIEHGHWVGYYPDTIKRHEARRKLGLADNEFVFLFIGLCQPYKNLHGLTAAFAALDAPAKLVIAGTFRDPSYEAKIRGDVARMDSRAQLYPGYVDDADMQIYLKACDIVVAPYLEILTSGTVMLAMSFGRPVIAPAKGFIKDVVTPGCGILYGSSDTQGLLDAMRTALTQRFDERAIRAHAASYDWVHTARTTREALEALVQNRSGNTVT
jgi:glycosyltransferase involved in cell wall biosynthesis